MDEQYGQYGHWHPQGQAGELRDPQDGQKALQTVSASSELSQAQKQREGEDNQCSCSGFVGRRLIKRSKGGKRVWAFLGKTESEAAFEKANAMSIEEREVLARASQKPRDVPRCAKIIQDPARREELSAEKEAEVLTHLPGTAY
ncbi:unnamed protein product [Cladocopium goreaui]|uniref:Uncharacterized protein n=1 Tax=Cladocopium goreaui TaxID=2562237 RepID=A0A9P1FTL8_9DINO|nr:unnamed protein product [Cladocopium goreaui]